MEHEESAERKRILPLPFFLKFIISFSSFKTEMRNLVRFTEITKRKLTSVLSGVESKTLRIKKNTQALVRG